ncbi:Hypothetical Protein RradSPS_0917 [Rubrobacter radiotolerans]|uniref:ZIP Zinc transporter n=1 Tax=Rubrobacter radiotolerans TaxID=42256 RepID=A0A023X2H5_RUBRA|nr:hypothetical protein [Rubrobacter radiotolerans]AHY46200.1 Hypothetical Protein RradSPS_0917 [Rubrobacter radiotolerans]MDX5893609.1 hypothetical protein [Rubrobacter radiotolerans]SMC04115.1 conserved hypothetical protein [Rubrobacter radiotolerans DSM 5868]
MSPVLVALALLFAGGLAAVHLFVSKLRSLGVGPRSRWLSLAGGVAVAYVFVHLMPKLAAEQERLQGAVGEDFGFLEYHVYLVSLVGLMVFYGLERWILLSRKGSARARAGAFWLHVASFGAYNVLIGYLLIHRDETGLPDLLFYAVAMALHFAVNDFGLRRHHGRLYDRFGRWVLAAAVLAGWAVGASVEISDAWIAVLIAFLGGAVIFNVLKEELPEERESRFGPFLAGAGFYAALLLLVP